MKNETLILLTVFVPVLGSFLLPLIGKISETTRNLCALIFVLVSLICSFLLLPTVMRGETISALYVQAVNMNYFYADSLAVFMAIVSSLVGAIIVLYSFGYISHYEHRNEYYFMVVLFLGSMMGIVYSRNLISIYVFWEITALACWRLIGFFRERTYVLRADKAFLVTVFGALMMLIGFLNIYGTAGSFDLGVISKSHVSNLAVLFIMFGILSKSATLPLHTWLPDAGVAPSPVTALLHAAVLVKIGVYVFARLFVVTIPLDEMWHTIIPIIAAVSALVSAGAALIDTDMKRIIAYSTVSQIGFIFLGLSIGNDVALAGGLLYILMHGLSKAALFLCAGIIEQATHTKDITKMGGLIKTMPVTAISFLICAFSVMGIPPLGGFFAKYLVINGAFKSGQTTISFVFLFGAVLTIIYLFRLFILIFMGHSKVEHPEKEGTPVMLISVATLAVLSILGGIFINYPAEVVMTTVQQIMGVVR
ncbi:MAG: NADH-quinone oxidoreductase subunit L [Proteobacteria bacterium]|nr:NADH-quinone oxidoreductase subunit L [Pseudomonadota bacterium]